MGTNKRMYLILTTLLGLSGTLPAAATDDETAKDQPPVFLNLVVEPGDGAATLRWDPPHNASPDEWQYRQNAGEWQNIPNDDADTAEYRVRGLTNGTTYTFEVRAHTAAGWGPASNRAVVTLNAAPGITGLESASFAENGLGPVTTYSARDAEGDPITWSLSGRDARAFTFTTDMERHTMNLVFRFVPDYERPSDTPPTDNDYQVTVVATDHGLPALSTHYPVTVRVVDVDEDGLMPRMAEPERSQHTTQAEHVGRVLRAVVQFYTDAMGWAVRGVVNHVRDVFGASKRTQSDASAPVPAGVPDAPAVAVYAGVGRIHVSVLKPASHGSALTGYEYQIYKGVDQLLGWTSAGVDATTLAASAPGAVSSFSVGGLIHGQPYAVAVRAVNGVGASHSMWGMATPGRILAPERLQTVAGDGLVALTWAAAATEGPVITRYEVRWRPIWGEWSAWTPVAGDASARSHTVEGLENDVNYTFEVRAAAGLVAQSTARPEVSVAIQVSYESAVYQAAEGGAGVAVGVRLSRAADQALTIPIQTIRNKSPRRKQAFIPVNCGALPAGLVESELFGHERGAFTSAVVRRIGHFERAHGGTLFLDEIGNLPLEAQGVLLHILEEGHLTRIGGTASIPLDVRIIAATNRDLYQAVRERTFRADLYQRLKVFPVVLPPLRQRREDIPLLATHFVRQYASKLQRPVRTVSAEAVAYLQGCAWPGNVRELAQWVERMVILSAGERLEMEDVLAAEEMELALAAAGSVAPEAADQEAPPLAEDEAEKPRLVAALQKTNWVVSGPRGAARLLGMGHQMLRYRMRKHGIQRPEKGLGPADGEGLSQ